MPARCQLPCQRRLTGPRGHCRSLGDPRAVALSAVSFEPSNAAAETASSPSRMLTSDRAAEPGKIAPVTSAVQFFRCTRFLDKTRVFRYPPGGPPLPNEGHLSGRVVK
jgi:hypothetical protein